MTDFTDQAIAEFTATTGNAPQTVITQENPDPSLHIVGAFVVPNQSPAESDWMPVLVGGIFILALSFMLTRK